MNSDKKSQGSHKKSSKSAEKPSTTVALVEKKAKKIKPLTKFENVMAQLNRRKARKHARLKNKGLDFVIRDGKQYKIVKKTLFFQGTAIVIEEEVSVDSGEDTDVRTSEDSFEADTKKVIEVYDSRMKAKNKAMDMEEKNKIDNIRKLLAKNMPNPTKNIFSRDVVFLVASFNDWFPVELKTVFEIKKL